ncbi:60S ribosomal protein L33-B [Puccinia sorghi]|uniref:60S ribosomal protein L33-B n=1 Tax=Puccinia sorghi TaxID=27349 RepID=A0A0L6ULM0_9BASI|nr:60S ribosomal protein L33-B [Puccinia sorghi]
MRYTLFESFAKRACVVHSDVLWGTSSSSEDVGRSWAMAEEPPTNLKMTRLYVKGRVLGYTRGKRNHKPTSSLVQLEGVSNKEEAAFYLGKRIAYVYRAQRAIKGSKVRIIWGKVTRPHGNSGVVRGRFSTNLPPRCFGASCRVVSSGLQSRHQVRGSSHGTLRAYIQEYYQR